MNADSELREYLETMADMHARIDGGRAERHQWPYRSIEEAVLALGRSYQPAPLDPDELRTAMVVREMTEPRYKECFRVAQYAEMRAPTVYVEGFATSGVLPVHHAWFTINGKVVDLTWRRDKRGKVNDHGQQFVFGTWPDGWAYFGVEIPWRIVHEEQIRTEHFSSILSSIQALRDLQAAKS